MRNGIEALVESLQKDKDLRRFSLTTPSSESRNVGKINCCVGELNKIEFGWVESLSDRKVVSFYVDMNMYGPRE